MSSLKHRFPGIEKDGCISYGGSQSWSSSKTLRRYGCGVISGTDLLLYLHLYHNNGKSRMFTEILPEGSQEGILQETYFSWVRKLNRRYLPVIPGFGLNGFVLVYGLNRFFRKNQIPYRARWGVWPGQLWHKMDEMLTKDLPVIFSIGPNFPFFWKKQKLTFYVRTGKGTYMPATSTKAHYVTATAADREWVQISSWGRRYYINKKEYEEYVKKHSAFFVSNLVLLRAKRQK